jgi:hypothetical protein
MPRGQPLLSYFLFFVSTLSSGRIWHRSCAGCSLARNESLLQTCGRLTRDCTRCKRTLPLMAASTHIVGLVAGVEPQPGSALSSARSWSPITLRYYLERGDSQTTWVCYDCQYPECSVCHSRPKFAVASVHSACRMCERARVCKICGERESHGEFSYHGLCSACQSKQKYSCGSCGK